MLDFNFDDSDKDLRISVLENALAECLFTLESIKDSQYKLDVDAKTSRVWSVWRKCLTDAEKMFSKHQSLLK